MEMRLESIKLTPRMMGVSLGGIGDAEVLMSSVDSVIKGSLSAARKTSNRNYTQRGYSTTSAPSRRARADEDL